MLNSWKGKNFKDGTNHFGMKKVFLTLLFLWNCFSFAQLPDFIILQSSQDTIKEGIDFYLRIVITRKDKSFFKFPTEFRIGEMFSGADLILEIEKANNGRFELYRCKQSPYSLPLINSNFETKEYFSLELKDTLGSLGCIEMGEYRIRVLFNAARVLKNSEEDVIVLKSNWINIVVPNNKIYFK